MGAAPRILAVYEPWFGHPSHISVGYSSHDPAVIRKQIDHAKALGISGFVVDWYGDREPFLDRSYALIQAIAAEKNFNIAMMYDETEEEEAERPTMLSPLLTSSTKLIFRRMHRDIRLISRTTDGP